MNIYVTLSVVGIIIVQAWSFDEEMYKLYRCDWTKVCENEKNQTGELKMVSGDVFNCYYGWYPKCVHPVPVESLKRTEYCHSLNLDFTFNKKANRCEVTPDEVEDDEDTCLMFD